MARPGRFFSRMTPPRTNVGIPAMDNPMLDMLIEAHTPMPPMPLQGGSGYILITNNDNQEESYLGRKLDFDVNRGNVFGMFSKKRRRGDTEKVILDGHVIWETQIRNANMRKLKEEFFDEFDVQSLTHAQVADIMADADDGIEAFGDTGDMQEAIENEVDELRAEMEAEYLERFEEDYQQRFRQEYPSKFSRDFKKYYTEFVDDELDDSVESHQDLYREYIVSPKHIRYKR